MLENQVGNTSFFHSEFCFCIVSFNIFNVSLISAVIPVLC